MMQQQSRRPGSSGGCQLFARETPTDDDVPGRAGGGQPERACRLLILLERRRIRWNSQHPFCYSVPKDTTSIRGLHPLSCSRIQLENCQRRCQIAALQRVGLFRRGKRLCDRSPELAHRRPNEQHRGLSLRALLGVRCQLRPPKCLPRLRHMPIRALRQLSISPRSHCSRDQAQSPRLSGS